MSTSQKTRISRNPKSLEYIFLGIVISAIGSWTFFRVFDIKPAILGDEYLYSLNSRHASPWELSPAGDFSNYLFNLLFSSTNLCGTSFYSCAKALNVLFFMGFMFVIFVIARKYLSFSWSLLVTIFTGLSPISVYTSMMLPESMYFFGLAVVALLVSRITDSSSNWVDWTWVGVAVGVTSLIKPHAWLTFMSLVIFLFVFSLGSKKGFLWVFGKRLMGLALGAVLSRLVIGLLVAGPKALGFFGIYLGAGIVDELSLPSGVETESISPVGTTPLNGAILLFPTQLTTHIVTLFALTAVMLCGLALAVIQIVKKRKAEGLLGFSLFVLIWTFSLLIAIVLFSGWITGGGDDHTTRVLLRYYDFVYVFIPLVGLAIFNNRELSSAKAWFRWGLAIVSLAIITTSFTGYFGSLTIQIADAPNLAGLVVDITTFNGTATLMALALLVFATFPRFTSYAAASTMIFSMVFTGWQIQEQYRLFRVSPSNADIAGQKVQNLISSNSEIVVMVVGSSRFESTNAAFWIDRRTTIYEVASPESVYPYSMIDPSVNMFVALSGITMDNDDDFKLIEVSDGYEIWSRKQ